MAEWTGWTTMAPKAPIPPIPRTQLKIDKGIPLPARKGRAKKYPFDQMDIGDSFLVPVGATKSDSSIYSSMSQAKKRLNINLTCARVDGGVRVWRIVSARRGNGEATNG